MGSEQSYSTKIACGILTGNRISLDNGVKSAYLVVVAQQMGGGKAGTEIILNEFADAFKNGKL